MTAKLVKWASSDGSFTKSWLSGRRNAVFLLPVVGFSYDGSRIEGHLGNVGLEVPLCSWSMGLLRKRLQKAHLDEFRLDNLTIERFHNVFVSAGFDGFLNMVHVVFGRAKDDDGTITARQRHSRREGTQGRP